MKTLWVLLLLCAPAFGQSWGGQATTTSRVVPPYKFCFGQDNGQDACFLQVGSQQIKLSGALDFTFFPQIVSTLPPATTNPGRIYRVTDGTTASDCATGGGATSVLCTSNGVSWVAVGSGSGGNISPGVAQQFSFYTTTSAIGPDQNLDDGLTTPSTITSQLTVAAPQYNVSGTGGLNLISSGGTLATPGTGNGGIGIATGAIPEINVNNAGWNPIAQISVGGTASTVNNANFGNSPAAPANGINVAWQISSANISAAIVGDGNAAHCFLGTGVFGACGSGGATALSSVTAATGNNTVASGNNPQIWNWAQTTNSQTAFTFGETSAATGTSDVEVGISTAAGSTATALNVANSPTGTQTLSAVTITPTWNTTGVVTGALNINVTDTASGSGSLLATMIRNSVTDFSVDRAGNVYALSAYGGTANATNLTVCGGNAASGCGAATVNGQTGGLTITGANNASNASGAKAGYSIFSGGFLTNATPNAAALEGVVQVGEGYLKSTIANLGDVVCATTTAFTITDCSHTGPSVNIVGIASNTSNPIGVISYGTALVKTDGAVTIGDILCMGTTTDGLAHDNGTTACPLAGTTIGIVIADSGSILQMSGSTTASTAMSTTLPLVQLHIGK